MQLIGIESAAVKEPTYKMQRLWCLQLLPLADRSNRPRRLHELRLVELDLVFHITKIISSLI